MILWATLAVAGLLAGPVASAPAADAISLQVPPLTGKSKVGTRSFELVDQSRPAGFEQSGPRRLMVQVTYPRAKRRPGACPPAEYLPAAAQAKLMQIFAFNDKVIANTRSCAGGVVMRRRSPLILFSHAYTSDRAVYTSLINDLASRGFIVASVDHTYDAFTVEFPGGELVNGLYGTPLQSKPIDDPELADLVEIRTRDIRFVTNWLLKQNRTKRSWLRQRIDRARIGVFGHSLGGSTAARVGLVDARFRASADVDGSLFGDWPLTAQSKKPFLLFLAEDGLGGVLARDKSCPWFRNAAEPKFAWQLSGAMHLTFSDLQVLAPQIAAAKPSWPYATLYQMIVGNLDPAASLRSQRNGLARFFRASLAPAGSKAAKRNLTPPAGVVSLTGEQLACNATPG